MPSLLGLTQTEAQKALENIGLVLGKVVVKQPRQEVNEEKETLMASRILSGIQDERTVLIDLTEKAAKAKVVREGYQVPPAALDKNKAQFEFDNFEVTPTQDRCRAWFRRVSPRERRSPGARWSISCSCPQSGVRFDVFEGVHADFKGKNVEFLTEGILDDAKTRQIFLTYENAEDIPRRRQNTPPGPVQPERHHL